MTAPPAQPWSRRARARGFTLIELMVVVALLAIATGVTMMSLRDPQAEQLDREAVRLVALLESARAQARMMGVAVHWEPRAETSALDGQAASGDFRFVGLPMDQDFPNHWLVPGVEAQVVGARAAVLGPEPVIGAQQILLTLADQRLSLVTDGLGPFTIKPDAPVN